MRYIWPPIVGLFVSLCGIFIAPLAMLPLCLCIKWDAAPTTGGDGGEYSRTLRGDLPGIWRRIFQTPDERFPGGLNEPTVVKWLGRYGKTWTSYLWAGTRNRCMGLSQMLGHEVTGHLPDAWGYHERDDVWRKTFDLGLVGIVVGWAVYGNVGPDRKFWAVPLFTFKRK